MSHPPTHFNEDQYPPLLPTTEEKITCMTAQIHHCNLHCYDLDVSTFVTTIGDPSTMTAIMMDDFY